MSAFSQIKASIRANLNDAGITFYSAADLTESVEDGYSDVLFHTRCLIKSVTLDFQASPYYDFKLLGVEDFMCVIAIFNNNTNRWLFDDTTTRDLDKIRYDWELWAGQPQMWAPVNFQLNVLVPYLTTPTGNFTLYYAAKAADVTDDTATPLIATDAQNLIENYSTGDLLEQAEEYIKATEYFKTYFNDLLTYTERVKSQAKRDLVVKM